MRIGAHIPAEVVVLVTVETYRITVQKTMPTANGVTLNTGEG
jgi:hypothetical protein